MSFLANIKNYWLCYKTNQEQSHEQLLISVSGCSLSIEVERYSWACFQTNEPGFGLGDETRHGKGWASWRNLTVPLPAPLSRAAPNGPHRSLLGRTQPPAQPVALPAQGIVPCFSPVPRAVSPLYSPSRQPDGVNSVRLTCRVQRLKRVCPTPLAPDRSARESRHFGRFSRWHCYPLPSLCFSVRPQISGAQGKKF